LQPRRPDASRSEIDRDRLQQYLERARRGVRGPLSIRQFKGGQSNPTYLLTTPAQRYVLRRSHRASCLSAHAVDREYKVITAVSTPTCPYRARTVLYRRIRSDLVLRDGSRRGRIFWDPRFRTWRKNTAANIRWRL
jgi:aminoglycoside phosphotransferase (APT) family kinase protein